MADESDSHLYLKPIYESNELRITGIIQNHRFSHLEGAFPSGKTNLMASSQDGKLVFLTVKNCIYVYSTADFSSTHPPDPSSFFPFNPLLVLKPSPEQVNKVLARLPPRTLVYAEEIVFNHICVGRIGDVQESLVAVGEFGTILVWNVDRLEDEPVLMEGSNDFESTWGIAISPQNYLIATSSNSKSVTIFHFPSRRVIYSLQNEHQKIHLNNIPSLDFSPCGTFLASCSIDGSFALWSLLALKVHLYDLDGVNWGWLIRFVPPSQYETIINSSYLQSYSKRFYNSNIKDDPEDFEAEVEDYDIDDEMDDEMDDDIDDDIDDEMDDIDYENEEIAINYASYSSLNISNNRNALNNSGNVILNEVFVPIGGAHLAEGAGDTWPSTDSENETTDPSAETPKSSLGITTIKFSFINSEGIELFPSKKSFEPCPYDLFYFTRQSLIIFNPATSSLKAHIKDLSDLCMFKQNIPRALHDNSRYEIFLKRLCMGEWIDSLGIFVVVDAYGHLITFDPKVDKSKAFYSDCLLVPDQRNSTTEIVGYTLIKKVDSEFGVKLHAYLIYGNGTFRLYEILKKG